MKKTMKKCQIYLCFFFKDLKEENGKLEGKIGNLTQDVQSRTNEMNREIRRKERAEREVKQLKGDVDEKQKEIADLKEDKLIIQVCFPFFLAILVDFFKLTLTLRILHMI